MTVKTRVREFEQTASAQLTLEQFNEHKTTDTDASTHDNQSYDFNQEADPPIYTRNNMLEARARAIQDGNI
jgi:hypothetical protein